MLWGPAPNVSRSMSCMKCRMFPGEHPPPCQLLLLARRSLRTQAHSGTVAGRQAGWVVACTHHLVLEELGRAVDAADQIIRRRVAQRQQVRHVLLVQATEAAAGGGEGGY